MTCRLWVEKPLTVPACMLKYEMGNCNELLCLMIRDNRKFARIWLNVSDFHWWTLFKKIVQVITDLFEGVVLMYGTVFSIGLVLMLGIRRNSFLF